MFYPRVFYHGTSAGVTDFCHRLRAKAEASFLINWGLFQRADSSGSVKSGQDALRIETPLQTVRAWVAVRVHTERLGRIPYSLAARFQRLCIEPSATLLPIVHVEPDLAHLIIVGGKRMPFSGDLGAPHALLLPVPIPQYGANILVSESTYDGRQCENSLTPRQRLKNFIDQALEENGTVLISAFRHRATPGIAL